jgi:hypothetical protein
MTHGDAIIDTNGVEFKGYATGGTHSLFGDRTEFLKMDVPWNQVDIRIADPDEWAVEIGF